MHLRGRLRRAAPTQWQRLSAEGIVSAGPGSYELNAINVREFRAADGRWLGGRLRIGSYCSIAPCDIFLSGNHRADWVSQYPFRSMMRLADADHENIGRGDVVIGSDVWIGDGALVLSGVTIGHGAVVGARSVVSHDVEPYTVVAGNPARVRRRRFDDATIEGLLASAWWDWPIDRIRENLDWLGAPPDRDA